MGNTNYISYYYLFASATCIASSNSLHYHICTLRYNSHDDTFIEKFVFKQLLLCFNYSARQI